jgi:hypothetical protein
MRSSNEAAVTLGEGAIIFRRCSTSNAISRGRYRLDPLIERYGIDANLFGAAVKRRKARTEIYSSKECEHTRETTGQFAHATTRAEQRCNAKSSFRDDVLAAASYFPKRFVAVTCFKHFWPDSNRW